MYTRYFELSEALFIQQSNSLHLPLKRVCWDSAPSVFQSRRHSTEWCLSMSVPPWGWFHKASSGACSGQHTNSTKRTKFQSNFQINFEKSNREIAKLWPHHEFLYTDGKSGRVKKDLTFLWHEADNVFYYDHKVLRKQLICLKKKVCISS